MSKNNVLVKQIWENPKKFLDKEVRLSGWVRTSRSSKTFAFIEFNDGSCYKNIQIVLTDKLPNFSELENIYTGSSLIVEGKLVKSEGEKQAFEVQAKSIEIVGVSDLSNPIQTKRHSFEFLRTVPHLRPRTNTFMATFRARSIVAQAIHRFFENKGFTYIHTPIITSNDAEGAGEMFRVTTLDLNKLPKTAEGKINYSEELLGKEAYLTVSGQLAVESMCFAYRNVYTFGPTFRAENSNTARHANEFWMIEPEIAFADLFDDMDLAEEFVKYLIKDLLEKAPDEMKFFNEFIEPGLIEKLENILKDDFARITYTEAIEILKKAKVKFEYPVKWEDGLQSEHERYLAETVYKKPVFVYNYPKEIKAFYMRLNDDGKTVAATDLLVPGIGEIIGGSQREERLDILTQKLKDHGLNPDDYSWYLDSRKFGTFPHTGFGLGFERAIMYFTGMKNVRDVITYPRTPNNIIF
ncbi:MAG TPA: asparagine--tRNA ligase [Candidatus Magasanikbacteria bacterium]|nr:asparagine--tRNA ligase [Candidatus Magasanikbacteria bacterium]